MRRPILSSALVVVVATGALAAATDPSGAATPAGSADSGQPTVAVKGTLLVIPAEPRAGGGGEDGPAYALRLAGGDLVPLDADFAQAPRAGSGFTGTLAVPTTVRRHLAARGARLARGQRLTSASRLGQAVLDRVDQTAVTMRATSFAVSAPALARAASGTTHRLLVAVPDNLGTVQRSDATILANLQKDATYWEAESNGAITDDVVPQTVTHYSTHVSGASGDCGLGDRSDTVFPAMADEASDLFPDFDPDTDQLVIEVPERGCSGSSFALGIGTVGSGFGSGGYLIGTMDPTLTVGTIGHEMGHNYGFAHANVRCGTSCSDEYGGIYDVMGYGLAGFNQLTALSTAYRVGSGITDPGEVQAITDAEAATARSIAPRSDSSGLRSLRVTDPTDGTVYYVDYRSGTGKDAGSAYAQDETLALTNDYEFRTGVVVTRAYTDSGAHGVEVMPNGTTTAFRAGQTWVSPSGAVRVSVSSLASDAATVRVGLPIATSAAPTITGAARVGSTVTATPGTWSQGVTFGYTWTLAGKTVSTASSYTLPAGSRGKQLVLQVTGSRSGSASLTRTSQPVTVRLGVTRVVVGAF